jgi:hypothetical protein
MTSVGAIARGNQLRVSSQCLFSWLKRVGLVYRRSGDDLVVVLEKAGKKQEFHFRRQGEK